MALENIFGAPPEYLSGLLGVDPEKLRKQALTTGLVNTALAFAAQPRNQRFGSVLPYAARALMAGQQGAQGVYQGALQDYQTRQQIEQLKRQQEQQQAQQQYVNQFATERPELASAIKAYPQLIPDIVKQQISPPKREIKEVGGRLVDVTGEKPSVVYEAPPETSNIKDYNFYVQQEVKEGRVPKSFNEWNIQSASAKAPKLSVDLSDPTAVAKVAIDLSERASKFYATDLETANQFKMIKSLADNPSPTGDTTLLYSLFKVLDPQSTVREGEVNMVMESRSIPSRLKGYAQRLAGGGTLLPQERNEIVRIAEERIKVRKDNVNKTRKAFVDNAKRLNLDPDLYVPNPYGDIDSQTLEVDY